MSKLKVFLCIFIPVLLIGGGVGAFFLFKSARFLPPKERVMLAVSQTLGENNLVALLSGNEENAGTNSVMTLYEGITTLASFKDFVEEDAILRHETDITIDELAGPDGVNYSQLSGAGLSVVSELDTAERNAYSSIDVRYGGYSLVGAEFFLNDNIAGLASDDFFDGYLAVDTESLGSDYNSSALAEIVGETIPDEYINMFNINLFDYLDQQLASDESLSLDANMDLYVDLYEAIEVEETDEQEDFSVGGDDLKCDEYVIIIPGESMSEFIDNLVELQIEVAVNNLDNNRELYYLSYGEIYTMDTGEDLMEASREDLEEWYRSMLGDEAFDMLQQDFEDLEIYVYLDSDNRLISFMIEEYEFTIEDTDIVLSLETIFSGEEFLFDETVTELTLTGPEEEEVCFTVETEGETDGTLRSDETRFTISETDSEEVAIIINTSFDSESGDFNASSEFDEVEGLIYEMNLSSNIEYSEEESFLRVEVDEFNIYYSDSYDNVDMTFSGSYELSVIDEVTTPSGDALYLLDMDTMDLTAFAMEVSGNFQDSPLATLLNGY